MRPVFKQFACAQHGHHSRPHLCQGCSEAVQGYREAVQAWRLSETAEMRARVKDKTKIHVMDQTTWDQWARVHKRKYCRSRRDREIRQVYWAEVFRRGFRSQVPIRFPEPVKKPREFYVIEKLLNAA